MMYGTGRAPVPFSAHLRVRGQEGEQVVLAHQAQEVELGDVHVGQAAQHLHKQLGGDVGRLNGARVRDA